MAEGKCFLSMFLNLCFHRNSIIQFILCNFAFLFEYVKSSFSDTLNTGRFDIYSYPSMESLFETIGSEWCYEEVCTKDSLIAEKKSETKMFTRRLFNVGRQLISSNYTASEFSFNHHSIYLKIQKRVIQYNLTFLRPVDSPKEIVFRRGEQNWISEETECCTKHLPKRYWKCKQISVATSWRSLVCCRTFMWQTI